MIKPKQYKSAETGYTRQGITLLEILLSIVILGSSMAAVFQLTGTGVKASLNAREQSEAHVLCQSKMEEILLGLQRVGQSGRQPFPEELHWTWLATLTPTDEPGLQRLSVTVEPASRNNGRYTLHRFVRASELK